jgi:hypothetical protein
METECRHYDLLAGPFRLFDAAYALDVIEHIDAAMKCLCRQYRKIAYPRAC